MARPYVTNTVAIAMAGAVKITNKERLTEQILAQLCINALRTRETTDKMFRFVTRVLVMHQVYAAETQNRPLYDEAGEAVAKWYECCMRDTDRGAKAPDPTTTERNVVVTALAKWQAALDVMTCRQFAAAMSRWDELEHFFVAEPAPTST